MRTVSFIAISPMMAFRLFSEEIDSRHNVALGNYPQAFTHIALINSAYNLQKAERRLAEREHHTDPVVAAIKLQQNH